MARPDPMLLAKGFLDHYKLVFGGEVHDEEQPVQG